MRIQLVTICSALLLYCLSYSFEPDHTTQSGVGVHQLTSDYSIIPSLQRLAARVITRQIFRDNPPREYTLSSCYKRTFSHLPESVQDLIFQEVVQHPQSFKLLPCMKKKLKHEKAVNRVCFTPDSKRVITTSDDPYVRVWDVATAALVTQFKTPCHTLRGCKLSLDGSLLIIGGIGSLFVWSMTHNRLEHTLDQQGPIYTFAITTNNRLLASASDYHSLKIWDLATGKEIARAVETPQIYSMWFTHGDTRLLINHTMVFRSWNSATAQSEDELPISPQEQSASLLNPFQSRLFYVPRCDRSESQIAVYDCATGTHKQLLPLQSERIITLALNDQSSLLIAGTHTGNLLLYDIERNELRTRLKNHKRYVWEVALSRDGRMYASASEDAKVVIWAIDPDLTTLKQILKALAREKKREKRFTRQTKK